MKLGRILLAAAAGALALFLAFSLFVWPWLENSSRLSALEKETADKADELVKLQRERSKLERWRSLSLPADPHKARRDYQQHLEKLLLDNRIQWIELRGTQTQDAKPAAGPQGKKAIYTPQTFTVRAQTSLTNLTQMLRQFQQAPLAHKIKSLVIEPTDARATKGPNKGSGLVQFHLTVEALSIEGVIDLEPRWVELDVLNGMRRGLIGTAQLSSQLRKWAATRELFPLAEPSRSYADLGRKNIFVGKTPELVDKSLLPPTGVVEEVDVKQYIYLTEITQTAFRNEAKLINRLTKQQTRLRASAGFNTFVLRDESGEKELVNGKVLRIDPRDLYFESAHRVYRAHIGQPFSEALSQPVSASELKDLGLKIAEQ